MTASRFRSLSRFAATLLLWALASAAIAAPVSATLYRDASCGCCHKYVDHLRVAGFDVTVADMGNRAERFGAAGVPPELSSCHMMRIGGYTVVGHVPLEIVARLLREQPDIDGIALPGMPIGTPGMPGEKTQTFVVRTLQGDVYARL
ncbi:Putative exported protein [Salinisphaera shabanensis E1L3A]|uniref:Exported protein n=1 Tax=Salinisphaera shabanensis E1L3A TaxID=1033802 RepID=F7Q8T4_9GAMM|nr:DUF411 domain-containing protein [Salinisphaera shabanensis]ERJ20096.1 Putative exported protein [Salinisphaera shabanensis E1L3A]